MVQVVGTDIKGQDLGVSVQWTTSDVAALSYPLRTQRCTLLPQRRRTIGSVRVERNCRSATRLAAAIAKQHDGSGLDLWQYRDHRKRREHGE
jgi:hypothetical protein